MRIGLIGCGKQAPKHLSGLLGLPDVEVVLGDADPQAAQALAGKHGLAWAAPEAILEDAGIAAVDICTPTPAHAGLITRALEANKDFFCEKPLCETVDEARHIAALAKRRGRIGMVGYIYRFAPVFEFAARAFKGIPAGQKSAVLGRVITANFRLGGRGGHQLWKHRRNQGGGAILEMLVHMIDLALWFFGRPRAVEILACDLKRPNRPVDGQPEEVDAEDFVLVRLKMESGVDVFCQADLLTPAFVQYVEVQGENGSFMGSIQAEIPSFLHCLREVAGFPAGRTTFNFGPRNLFEAQMAEFVDAITSRSPAPRSSIDDSIVLLETLQAVEAALGRR